MTPTCSVEGCEKAPARHRRAGMCEMHVKRLRLYGSLDHGRPSTTERFWPRVEKTETCWNWRGTTHVGYGRMNVDGRRVLVHRWSYEHHVGPIPEGLTIDHLCRNTLCVNPAHLEPVTRSENTRRARAARRADQLRSVA